MAKEKEKKTNAMRILDKSGIAYRSLSYTVREDDFDGQHVAAEIGLPAGQVFKTLVTRGGGEIVVCCIPADKKLDLKALAAAAGRKALDMLPLQEILAVTGYVRGGCSPVGMKKQYPTFLDQSAFLYEEMAVSAGVRGRQLLLRPSDLANAAGAKAGPFAKDFDTL